MGLCAIVSSGVLNQKHSSPVRFCFAVYYGAATFLLRSLLSFGLRLILDVESGRRIEVFAACSLLGAKVSTSIA